MSMFYDLTAALPPVAILVLAAGSLLLRRRHRLSFTQECQEVVDSPTRSVRSSLTKSRSQRKRSRVSATKSVKKTNDVLQQVQEKKKHVPSQSSQGAEMEAQTELLSLFNSSSTNQRMDGGDESTEPWTSVKRKSRTSRKSSQIASPTLTASVPRISMDAPGGGAEVQNRRHDSVVASSAEEALARSKAGWFTDEVEDQTQVLDSQLDHSGGACETSQDMAAGKEPLKSSASVRAQQSITSVPGPVLTQTARPKKSWAAVTADKQSQPAQGTHPLTDTYDQATPGYLASFPAVSRASEFGAIGDRKRTSSSQKEPVVGRSLVVDASGLDMTDLLAKKHAESLESTLSSPRSIGSTCTSPRSDTSTVEGMIEEDEQAGKAAELEYIASHDMRDTMDPIKDLESLHERLESLDWLQVAEALNNLRALVLFHAEITESVLPNVAPQILKAMKNPRSALQKTAIMSLTDTFKSLGDKCLPWVNVLLLELFLKASQDKKFVCETADEALKVMAASLSPAPLIEKVLPFTTHKSQRVRAKAIAAVYSSLLKMNLDEIVLFGHERLLKAAKRLQNDKQPEARDAARKMADILESRGKVAPV